MKHAELASLKRAAKAQGLSRFFTGRPCRNGHIAERWIVNGKCVECRKDTVNRWRINFPEKSRTKSRRRNLRRIRCGMTIKDLHLILGRQGGLCAICGKKIQLTNKESHIDHCHETGKFRGILCPQCNMGLGMFKDNAGYLSRAISYLKKEAIRTEAQ